MPLANSLLALILFQDDEQYVRSLTEIIICLDLSPSLRCEAACALLNLLCHPQLDTDFLTKRIIMPSYSEDLVSAYERIVGFLCKSQVSGLSVESSKVSFE